MDKLKGKIALVTGGSRGIGRAIALHLAEEGAHVAITYAHAQEEAQQVVSELQRCGVKAAAYRADASQPRNLEGLIERVAKEMGGFDILVNNAGIYVGGSLQEATEEDFDLTVNVNIRACFLLAKQAADLLPAGGRIINIGSILGERVGEPGACLYAMSKFAVAGLTRSWARELGARDITVNCVQPGPIDTDMNPADGPYADAQRKHTALGRYGDPEDIAATVAFLASPDAKYLTGSCINVDGGYIA